MTARETTIPSPGSAAACSDRCGGPNTYAEVASTVWRYYDAIGEPTGAAALAEILDPVWNGKQTDTANDTLAVETRAALLARVAGQGPQPSPAGRPHLTSVQVYFDDFAVARTDDFERAATTILTLFKTGGAWRIAGEASSGAEHGTRQTRFNPKTAETEVLRTLDAYYRAVEAGDAGTLRRIFDPGWHMKNHEGDAIVAEGNEAFYARVAGKPLAEYASDRQISDVQIVSDRMAWVRVDKPSRPVVTVFVFFKLGSEWTIIDKAWSNPKD